MRYFAYGSNLCVPRLVHRRTRPSNPRTAHLPGYRIGLHKLGIDGSSKATIHRCHSTSVVWGVVFEMGGSCREELRRAEGFPDHYREEQVTVRILDEHLEVTTYIARADKLVEGVNPYGWYMNHILMGARTFGFPDDYVRSLEKFGQTEDPDTRRDSRERAFWEDHRP